MGMLTGPEALLGMQGVSGLRPCVRNHLKKGLVPHSSGWWDGRQIPLVENVILERKFKLFVCLFRCLVDFIVVHFCSVI